VSIIGAGMKLAYVVCLWIICLLINRAFECVCVCVCVCVCWYAGMGVCASFVGATLQCACGAYVH